MVVALASASGASAHSNDPPQPLKRGPCGHKISTHRHGVADAKRTDNLKRLRHYAHCARTPAKERRIRERIDEIKQARQDADPSNWCSPTPVADGAGCWEIPAWCVEAESGGSWTAQNPSSPARGPYQLLGHGEPWPVSTRAQAMAHHRIAADLYASQGLSPWVAC